MRSETESYGRTRCTDESQATARSGVALLIVLGVVGGAVSAALGGDIAAFWANGDGYWASDANWTTPQYPNNGVTTYDATVDVTGDPYTVILASDVSVDTLTIDSLDAIVRLADGTFAADSGILVNSGVFEVAGGVLSGAYVSSGPSGRFTAIGFESMGRLAGVTLAADLSVQPQCRIGIENGLTLDGAAVLLGGNAGSHHYYSRLVFLGDQVVEGSGEIVPADGLSFIESDGRLEFQQGVDVRTGGGSVAIENPDHDMIFRGGLRADVNGIEVVSKRTFTRGPIEVVNGGKLDMRQEWMDNVGPMTISGNSWAYIAGAFTNVGLITISDTSKLTLQGPATTAGLGPMAIDPTATVEICGQLDNTGHTLDLAGNWVVGGTITGGTITAVGGGSLSAMPDSVFPGLDGVTLAVPLTVVDDSKIDVTSHLTLSDVAVSLVGPLRFVGGDSLKGTGEIVIDGSPATPYSRSMEVREDGMMTIESGITVRSGTGSGIVCDAVNYGTISAGTAGKVIGFREGVNEGTIQASDGGKVLFEISTNRAAVSVSDGGTLNFGPYAVNEGTISATDATVRLCGDFTLVDLGTVNRVNSPMVVVGTLDNAGTTLAIDPAEGGWELDTTGKIIGGTVAGPGSLLAPFKNESYPKGPTLSGVTLATELRIADGATVKVENGLTLAGGRIHFGEPNGVNRWPRILFSDAQILGGNGELVFEDDCDAQIRGPVTLGPGITLRAGLGNVGFSGAGLVIQGTILNEQGKYVGFRHAMTNEGLIRGANDSRLEFYACVNTGTIEMTDGFLLFKRELTNEGIVSATGSTLELYGLGDTPNPGTITAVDCAVKFTGEYDTADVYSLQRIGGTLDLHGTLDNTGATLTADASTGSIGLGATVQGGVLAAADGQQFVLKGPTLQDVDIQTDLVADDDNHLWLYGSTNRATIELRGTGELYARDGFVNEGAILLKSSWADVRLEGSWTNSGEIRSVGWGLVHLDGTWTNSGTIRMEEGVLYLDGEPVEMGEIILDGAGLGVRGTFTPAQINTVQGRTSVSVGKHGHVVNTGGVILMGSGEPAWQLSGGRITGGTIRSQDGTPLVVREHPYSSSVLDGVNLEADMNVQYRAKAAFENGLTLGGGTVTLDALAWLLFTGDQTLDGTGEVVFAAGSSCIRPSNGTLTIGPDITARAAAWGATVGYRSEDLINQGIIAAEDWALNVVAGTLSNTGVLQVGRGRLSVSPGSPFANEGTLAAGAGGLIEVDGDLTQTGDAAALSVEIGGATTDDFGQLAVEDAAELAGALNIAVVNGFVPEVGAEFEILTCGSRSGRFDEVTGWLATGLALVPIYEDQRVCLHATFVGDANLDGQVGIADLVAMADHYGMAGAAQWRDADFNLDGEVGIADLVALADHYGQTGGGTVPEPGALALLALGGMLLAGRRRQQMRGRSSP